MAVAASLAVAGCGSGKSSSSTTTSQLAFKTALANSQRGLRSLITDIAKDIAGARSRDDAQLAKEFAALSTRAGRRASQLDGIKAPRKYAKTMAGLVSGVHAVKADLVKISTAAHSNDASTAQAAARALLTDAAKVKTADVSLSKALGLSQPGGASSTSRSSSASATTTTSG